MRPLPVDYHQFLSEIEELHGHGILYRGGPDGEHLVCGHEDCDEFIVNAEILRGGVNYRAKRDPKAAERDARIKRDAERAQADSKRKAEQAEQLRSVAAWRARNDVVD